MKALPSIIETQLFPGIKATLDLRDETQRTTYWFGTRFEEPTPQILQLWAADATHFFDIGSNYGFYSFFLRSFSSDLEIYPFEPNPISFQHLSEICAVNRASRIHPQAYGLSDQNQRLKFLQLAHNTGHSSFATGEAHDEGSLEVGVTLTECDVTPFDEAARRLCLSHPIKPSWIAKIDVEGYEMKVLLGMTEALRDHAFKGICVELFEENLAVAGTSIAEVDAFLQSYGYQSIHRRDTQADRLGRNHNAFYVVGTSDRETSHV